MSGKVFKINTTPEPRLSQAQVINKVKKQSTAPVKKERKKREKREYKQVSLLLDIEQYEYVAALAEDEERSMTKVILRYLVNKGFFND